MLAKILRIMHPYTMSANNNGSPENRIGQKYSEVATSFLEQNLGRVIDPATIEQLGGLLAGTQFELAGTGEAQKILGFSRQRLHQIKDRLPPIVCNLTRTPVWLKDDLVEFNETRKL